MPSTTASFSIEVTLDSLTPGGTIEAFAQFSLSVDLVARVASSGNRRRVLVVNQAGEVIANLENATASQIVLTLDDHDTAQVTLPTTDPKLPKLVDKKYRELQIWRGNRLWVWGPTTRPNVANDTATFPVKGASYYLSRRFVGSATIVNRLANADFMAGLSGWTAAKNKFFMDFQPLPSADATTVSSPSLPGVRAAKLTTIYDAGHEGWGQVSIDQEFLVTAGPFGLHATLTVWVYVPASSFVSYGSLKDKGMLLIRMPSDYRTNNFFAFNPPDGSRNTWGGLRAYFSNVIGYSVAAITDQNPFDQWFQMALSIDVPPGATEIVSASLQGIEGVTYWAKPRLTFNDGLQFNNVDQGAIIEQLVEHAQDPAFGKTDVNIDTSWRPSVPRVLEAEFREHANIWQLISAYTPMGNGVDVSMRYTGTKRTLAVSYPQLGNSQPSIVLATGKNVASVDGWTFDGENAASSQLVLGAGQADTREEAGAVDASDYADDVVIESVNTAPPETQDSDLPQIAQGNLASSLDPEVVQVTTDPNAGLVDLVNLGDWMPVRLAKGPWLIVGTYRIVKLQLNDDDSLGLTMNKVPS